MKLQLKLGLAAAALVVVIGANPVALAQVDWTWEEIAVPPGPPGSWDSSRHHASEVVFDGTTYHMYLVGGQVALPWDGGWQVGHWTWNALTQAWDEDPANPVVRPDPGQWDEYTIYSCAVYFDGSMFHMWYGAAAAFPGAVSVGHATSLDGSEWTKDPGNPLPGLGPGPPGAWDDAGVAANTVLYDGSGYRMWFTAFQTNAGDFDSWRIGTASSPDGINWTKHPDPVLEGTQASWEEDLIYAATVVPSGDGYAMWYSSLQRLPSPDEAHIGYAVSPDGIHWGKWPENPHGYPQGNPVISPLPGCNAVDSLAVIVEGDTVHGWTTNCNDVHYLTSPLEHVFFDAFETGDTAIWSSVVP
jgi:hypothetical protein